MMQPSSKTLSQSDLTQLDQFLISNAKDHEVMGLSYIHGFLTALTSGPENLTPDMCLQLVFNDSTLKSGKNNKKMKALVLRLFEDIEHRLKTNVGFLPIFDKEQDDKNHRYNNAQPWCLGFTDGVKLFSEHWTNESNNMLRSPLALIFSLADVQGLADSTYSKLCDRVPDAAEYIYCFWQKARQR